MAHQGLGSGLGAVHAAIAPKEAPNVLYVVLDDVGFSAMEPYGGAFTDLKWPRVAATTRRTHAEALTAVTTAMLTSTRGRPNGKLLRAALKRWAFNTARRDDPNCPGDVRNALRWAASHTRPVAALREPRLLRQVLDGLTVKLDGTPAAPSVTSRRRKVLHAAWSTPSSWTCSTPTRCRR
jgi:hypothetical protein